MNQTFSWTRRVLAASVLSIAGCASNSQHEAAYGEAGYDDEAHVLAEICVPGQHIDLRTIDVDMSELPAKYRGEDSHMALVWSARQIAAADKQVRMVLGARTGADYLPQGFRDQIIKQRDGYFSAGGSNFMLIDKTTLGQPVLRYFGPRPASFIASSISTGRGDAQIDYWFTLPSTPLTAEFTAWMPPVSQEDAAIRASQPTGTDYRVVYGGKLPIHPVTSAWTPKMRFRLQTNRERFDADKRFEPAHFAVFEQFRRQHPSAGTASEPLPRLVPMSNIDIPGC